MVVAAAADFSGAWHLHCLFHLGGVAGRTLPVRPVPLAVLRARVARRSGTCLVRRETVLVPSLASLLRGYADPVGSRRLSLHVLLLSRRLLQGVLGRSTRLHGGRAAKKLLGRGFVSTDHPERAPLLPLFGDHIHRLAGLRRMARCLVPRTRWR